MFESFFSVLLLLAVIGTILVVIADNGHPRAKLAWIVVIAVLPVLGIVLYMLFGISPRHHWMYERRRRRYTELFEREKDEALTRLLFERDTLGSVREDYRALVRLLASGSSLNPTTGNSFEIITEGGRKYELLMHDLENARESIHMEYFHFGNDKGSKAVREILLRKAGEGVKVRFLNENIANLPILPKYYNDMRKAGVEVQSFSDPRHQVLEFATKLNYRNHRKIVVVDGRIGYIGGMNINDRYFRKWRDTHLRITGDAVSTLQYVFLDSWITSGGSLDRPMAELYPMLGSKVEQHEEGPDRFNGKTIQIVADEPYLNNPVIQMSYEWTLLNAREYVYMQTPYFIPPEPTLNAIRTAALSGVDVRLMLPARNDTIFMGEANRSFYGACLEAGVRIFERGGEFMHSKTFVCDDYLSCIGSANIDNRSFNISYEANAYIYDEQVARRNKEIFLEDQKLCREITLEEFGKTGFPKVFFRHILHLFSPLL